MKLRALLLFGCTAWFAPAQEPPCHPVEGDRIQAHDLAIALPEFGAVPSDTLLAQAPIPGSQHIFHPQELLALAHRFGIKLTATPDVCFEWAMHPLDRTLAMAAMQDSLQNPAASIRIAEIAATRAPSGRIEFPLDMLGKPSGTRATSPVLWRGNVVYGDDHRFPIWARVDINASCRKVTAAESLKAGQLIEARQLRSSTFGCFPGAVKEMPPVDKIAGMVALHAISAGSELRPETVAPPNEVNRGESVLIEVHSGSAHLAFSARALTGGRNGDTITVRNPDSNRIFQARVTGKGTALVATGGPRGD